MAVIKTTLSRQTTNGMRYVYPKTSADMVEYDSDKSIREKLQEMDGDIENLRKYIRRPGFSGGGGNVTGLSKFEILFDTAKVEVKTMPYEIVSDT